MLNAKGRFNEDCTVFVGGGGEDTVAGQRGILDLDLNHDLDPSGKAQSAPHAARLRPRPPSRMRDYGGSTAPYSSRKRDGEDGEEWFARTSRARGAGDTNIINRRCHEYRGLSQPHAGTFREGDGIVPPRRGGDFFSLFTRGVARRHPWLLEWHPFRMRYGKNARTAGIAVSFRFAGCW